MSATIAVMMRELTARREVPLLAVAAAVIATLTPLLPGLEAYGADDVRTVASTTLALALGWGLAVLFGATLFGRDLSEGRLGFFFARPVGALAVWCGRMLAAVLLILICEGMVLVPSLFGGVQAFVSSRGWGPPAVIGYLVAPLLLLLLAHAVSIMVRARTAWLFLDLAGCVSFAVIAWLIVRPYLELSAQIALWVIAGASAGSLLVALAVGGASGIAIGRVDLQRTHTALSLALWATLAVCVAGITAWSGWLRAFAPSEFSNVDTVTVSPDGCWVEVLGGTPHRLDVTRRYLVSTVDHRWVPLPGGAASFSHEVVYSQNGSTAMWLGTEHGDDPRGLWWADLSRPDPSAHGTNLAVSPDTAFVLSPDGDQVAILEDGTLSVYELASEHLVTAIRLPQELHRVTMLFIGPGSLRLFAESEEGNGHSLLIAEADVATGEVRYTGEVEDLANETWFALDADMKRIVMCTRTANGGNRRYSVIDANSGRELVALPGGGFWSFLSDGRLVVLQAVGDGTSQLVVETVGQEGHIVHHLERAKDWRISGEVLPGVVAVLRLEDLVDPTLGLHVELVDVETGEVRYLGTNLRRALPWFRWLQGSTKGIFWYGNRPAASRLFIDQNGALVRWDPESGELVHVVGGRPESP